MSGRHCADFTAQLEQRVSDALNPSLITKVVRLLNRRNNQADCSLFPNTLLYSFEQADLWLSLTLLPCSETSTQVRYDLFGHPQKTGIDEASLARAVEQTIQVLIGTIQSEFQSIAEHPVESSQSTHRILKQLHEHQKLERANGGLILPAMRRPKGSTLFQQAEQCKFLPKGLDFLKF